MRGRLFATIFALLIALSFAEEYTTFPYTIEAEDCEGVTQIWTSVYERKIKGIFTGTGFAYLQNTPFSFNVTVPEDGMYQFTARMAQILNEDGRQQTISINGVDFMYKVPYYDTWTDFDFGMHRLNKGSNKISFKPIYGYAEYDSITVSEATFPDFSSVPTKLSDPKATPEAQKVQDYLGSVYGKKIVSGQQEIYGGGNNGNYELEFDYIYDLSGKYPAVRGFDFMNYNPLYGWDDQTTERVIDWVNKRGGIATASWHINVPIDFENYEVGDKVDWQKCTYATKSSFKTEDCIVEGTKENDYWNAAIKMLAEQLKRLQDANVPLIFRPLHEAEGNANTDGSGAWFWWGKAGAKTYVKIWKYLYEKLTKEYELHNLIWEQNLYAWNSDSAQWYAGDEYVDMVGYDKYNTVYNRHDGKTSGPNLDSESEIFYTLVKFVDNKKMVAMAENDSIPSVYNLIIEHAAWLYFCPWYGEFILDEKNNAKADLKELYTHEYCITLDDVDLDNNTPTYPDFSKVPTKLSDPKATPEAQKVQDYLGSVYGKKIVSGQQEIYGGGNNGNYELEFDYIYDLSGKYPAVRGFDFMNYNPLYGWDDQTTERVIDWVNKRGGIATASWHINVPIDFENYEVGDKVDWQKCTYATKSSFKTEDCIVEGTKENDYWNAAIKMLAEQLKRLQDANVPLIFRPLHEAEGNANTDGSGAWFWWGKAGAKTYVKIWKYLYEKLTKEYELHNLIWEQNLYAWNSDSAQWYAGDEYVDMVGYDKYNTVYNRHDGKTSGPNLDSESEIFYTLVKFVDNKKMVAMAENDSIPGVNNLIKDRAAWLYFCPWYGEHILEEKNNAKADLKEIYTHEYCVTLEDIDFKNTPTIPDFSSVPTKLSDPKATPEAQKVQDYLGSVYGKKIVSGQQEIYGGGNNGNYELEFDYIYDLSGKYPAVRGFDFMNYNPLYGWDDQTTERVIDWVNKRGGIATASWHINVPIDFENYEVGDKVDWQKCTYATKSSFKTEDCIVEGTKENDYWNAAIKMLAEQLKRLQDANVPLIFRPLHEAEGNANTDGSGAWFWWGKAGAKTYVKIWKYLYEKLTKEYELHNLIWEQNLYAWNSDSAQWYAGDEYVDMVGYDKYNTVYNRHDGKTSGPNLDSESSIFLTLVKFVNNKKMVAMAENDSIPSVTNLIDDHAAWLYFCPWYGEFILDEKNNAKTDLKEIYTHEYCVTLADLPFLEK